MKRESVPRGLTYHEGRGFFAAEYTPMADVTSHLGTIVECGCKLVGLFTLPESSWRDPYHRPLAARPAAYEPPGDDEETQAVLGMIRREIDIYRRFSRWYGYVFFLVRTRCR